MPENSTSTVDLVLRYIVDQQSQKSVEQSIREIEKITSSGGSGKEILPDLKPGNFNLNEFLEYARKSNKSIEELINSTERYGEAGRSSGGIIEQGILKNIARLEQMSRAAKEVADSLNEIGKSDVSPDTKNQSSDNSGVSNLSAEEQALVAEEEAIRSVEKAAEKKSQTVVDGLSREEQYTADETKRLEELNKAMLESQEKIQDGINNSGKSSGSNTFSQFSKEDEEIIRQTVEMSELLGISIDEAAKNMVNLGNAAGRTKEELVADVELMQEMTGATEETEKSTEKLSQSSAVVSKNIETTATAMRGFAGFTLLRVAREFETLGKSIYTPIDAFTKAEGYATISSGKFLIAQKDIQNSTERIGQVMTESVLHALEKVSELASKTADFVEAHPEVAQAAVGLAAGAYTIGGILQVLGTIFTVLSALKVLGLINPGQGSSVVSAAKEVALQSQLAAANATVLSAEEGVIAAEEAAVAAEARAAAAEAESASSSTRIAAAEQRALAAESEIAAAEARVISANERTLAAEGGVAKTATVSTGSSSGLAAAGVYALAVAMGAYIGHQIGNLANKALGQQEQSWADNLVTVLKLVSIPLATLEIILHNLGIASQQNVSSFQKNLAEMFAWAKSLDGTTVEMQKAIEAQKSKTLITQDEIKAYINYKQQQRDAEKNYEDERTKIVNDAGQAQADAEQKYEDQRQSIIDDFNTSAAQKAQDFYIQQSQRQQDFFNSQSDAEQKYKDQQQANKEKYQEEERRAKEQHEDNLRKLEEEHNKNVYDLSLSRDALGLVNEDRAYKQKVDEENRRFSEEEQARAIQFKLQQAQDKRNFEEQQAIAQRNFEEQQARELAKYELEKQRAEEAEQKKLEQLKEDFMKEALQRNKEESEKLDALSESYKNEQEVRLRAFANQLVDLGINLGNEQTLKNQYYAAMYTELDNWLKDQQALFDNLYAGGGSGTPPPKATGGYASFGKYMLGDDGQGKEGPEEFVLTGSTTKMAEKMIGGRLEQSDIIKALAGKQRTGTDMNITINASDNTLVQTVHVLRNNVEELANAFLESLDSVNKE